MAFKILTPDPSPWGEGDRRSGRAGRDGGFQRYIVKPFDLDDRRQPGGLVWRDERRLRGGHRGSKADDQAGRHPERGGPRAVAK